MALLPLLFLIFQLYIFQILFLGIRELELMALALILHCNLDRPNCAKFCQIQKGTE